MMDSGWQTTWDHHRQGWVLFTEVNVITQEVGESEKRSQDRLQEIMSFKSGVKEEGSTKKAGGSE